MVSLGGSSERRELAGACPIKLAYLKRQMRHVVENQPWGDAPESITTPAIVVPWPPIHLVALCTDDRTDKQQIASILRDDTCQRYLHPTR